MPKSSVLNEERLSAWIEIRQREGNASPQGCVSSKWVGCGLEKGWNELDKGKRRSNFQNFESHYTKNHPHHPTFYPFLGFAILRPHLEKCASLFMRKHPNSQISSKRQHLPCSPCPDTCQVNLRSHKIHFWQLSFIFLIAEFFQYFIFWVFFGFFE